MRNVVRGLAVWALCSTQLGCGPVEPSQEDSTLESYESSLSTHYVGVLAPARGCPSPTTAPSVWFYMDNENGRNISSTTGWTGNTHVTPVNDAMLMFCRVDGTKFQPLSLTGGHGSNYAVLKLSDTCPPGSVDFGKRIDNEDENINHTSGPIHPNVQDGNTTLYFCLFRGGTAPASSLPNLGFEYGVFATPSFTFGTATGRLFTDDEDTRNINAYYVNEAWRGAAEAIVSNDTNTTFHMARAGTVFCGDNVCNALETESSCAVDCTVCGNGVCGSRENATSCPYDCGRCGDGVCGHNETRWNCEGDCSVCGDTVCNGDETPSNCPLDCHNCDKRTSSSNELFPHCPGPNG